MTLLGLDPATKTGVALCEPFSAGRPSMRLSSWQMPPKVSVQEKIDVLRQNLVALCKAERIDFAAIELPQAGIGERDVPVETLHGIEIQKKAAGDMKTQTQLWAIHGAIIAILGAFRIPYRTVGVSTWRKSMLGNGRMASVPAKRRCKELLEQMGVYVPNQDAGEAGMIALWLNGHRTRFEQEDRLRRAA